MSKIQVPVRFKGRTGYQIFVDRYCRAGPTIRSTLGRKIKDWNDVMPDWKPDQDGEYRNEYFYGGDLLGIISKLDYIKSMGFDFIILTPISKTHTYHHYDVENQTVLDDFIGSWLDFEKLCNEAHKRDILICVDLVFNHMGSRSEAFTKAMQGDPYYKGWFSWTKHGYPIFWYGFKDMPETNKSNHDYIEYVHQTEKKYILMGADAVRFDLGEILPLEFLRDSREFIKSINPEVLMISEMWDLANHRENPQIYGDQVDSVMNPPLADAILRWTRWGNNLHLDYTIGELSKYPNDVHDVLWNMLDSHDTPRAITMLNGEGMCQDPFSGRIWDIEARWRKPYGFDTYNFRKWERDNDIISNIKQARRKLEIASLIQYLMKGIPVVFAGTEVGISGYKDPFNRKPYNWEGGDQELRVHYTSLGRMRSENRDILATGNEKVISDSDVLKIVRSSNAGSIIALVNRCDYAQRIDISLEKAKEIFNINGSTKREIAPLGAIVCRI